MEKIFISYAFTNHNSLENENNLNKIKKIIINRKYKYFCSFWWENYFRLKDYSNKKIYDFCLKKQMSCNVFFAFINSDYKSIGMLKELNLAKKLHQKRILAIKKGLKFSNFRNSANIIIEFDSIDNLCLQLKIII